MLTRHATTRGFPPWASRRPRRPRRKGPEPGRRPCVATKALTLARRAHALGGSGVGASSASASARHCVSASVAWNRARSAFADASAAASAVASAAASASDPPADAIADESEDEGRADATTR